jgi:hypothetical protein
MISSLACAEVKMASPAPNQAFHDRAAARRVSAASSEFDIKAKAGRECYRPDHFLKGLQKKRPLRIAGVECSWRA